MKMGVNVRLTGTDGEDLGFAHAPAPVELGDVLALANGSIWRVVSLIDLFKLEGSALLATKTDARFADVLCMVEPAWRPRRRKPAGQISGVTRPGRRRRLRAGS